MQKPPNTREAFAYIAIENIPHSPVYSPDRAFWYSSFSPYTNN